MDDLIAKATPFREKFEPVKKQFFPSAFTTKIMDVNSAENNSSGSNDRTSICFDEDETLLLHPYIFGTTWMQAYQNQNLPLDSFLNSRRDLSFETRFLPMYYKNDNKCLQCFPCCPEFGNYEAMRLQGHEHRQRGRPCASCVELTIDSFHLSSDVLFLGRIVCVGKTLSNVYHIDETKNHVFSADEVLEFRATWIEGRVAMNLNEKTVSFLPRSWKLFDNLKRKRTPTNKEYVFEVVGIDLSNNLLAAYKLSPNFLIGSAKTLSREKQRQSSSH